jgi:hypothetical protein
VGESHLFKVEESKLFNYTTRGRQDEMESGFGSKVYERFMIQRCTRSEGAQGSAYASLLVTVRVPGGLRADGLALRIWGAPGFTPGERALLFLFPRLDGTYSIAHLMLGAFHEIRTGGHDLALRHLSENGYFEPSDGI